MLLSLRHSVVRSMAAGAVTVVLCGASCTPIVPGEVGPDRTAGDQWQVRWDPVLRTPAALVNRALADESESGGTVAEAVAVAAVHRVIRDHDTWFQLRPEDAFRPVASHPRGYLRFVRFEQTYRGVSVAGGGYDANVLSSGRVGSLEGRYYPGLVLDVAPRMPSSQAETIARGAFPIGGTPQGDVPAVQFETENGFRQRHVLAIVPRAGNYVLAWGVVVQTSSRDWLRVYVDATTGAIIGRQPVGWSENR